eukprot:scaffold7813_cov92-Amphora_coffeaeformis.AAC.1
MESADDNSTYSGYSETFLTPTLRRRPLPSDVQVGQAKSSRKKAKQSEKCEPVYTRLPTNTKSISSLLTNLKRKLKSKPYDKIPSNHIAHCRYVCDVKMCKLEFMSYVTLLSFVVISYWDCSLELDCRCVNKWGYPCERI